MLQCLGRLIVSVLLTVGVVSGAIADVDEHDLGLPTHSQGLAQAAFSRGVKLTEDGRNDEAIKLFQLAIELSPDIALYHEVLGDAHVTTGGADSYLLAKEEYKVALQLEPGRRRAQEGLAQLALATGRLGEALDVLESLSFGAGDPDLQYLTDLVSLYIAADQTDRGIETMEPHARSATVAPSLLLHLAVLQRSRGSFEAALAFAVRVQDHPDASVEVRTMARDLHAQWSEERREQGNPP